MVFFQEKCRHHTMRKTHYPILNENFERQVPSGAIVLDQGPIVAKKLKDYLTRHPALNKKLTKKGKRLFLTTDASEKFDHLACVFYGKPIYSQLISLESF